MKPIIIAIVGPSGSGKTLAAEIFGKEDKIPVLCSYTTRPMREGEVNGVDHWFVTEDRMPQKSNMLAYTFYGGFHYWTNINQCLWNDKCVYVIDEKGLIELQNDWGDVFCIVPILIKRKYMNNIDRARIERDKERTPLPENHYQFIINNDGTIEELTQNIKYILNNI